MFCSFTFFVMSHRTFTREQVRDMLTILAKDIVHRACGSYPIFSWENTNGVTNPEFDSEKRNLYNSMLGQSMTVLETASNPEKFGLHRGILMQLCNSAHEDFLVDIQRKMDSINIPNSDTSYGFPYSELEARLNAEA